MEKEVIKKNEVVALLNHLRLKHIAVRVKDEKESILVNGFITKSDNNYLSIYFETIPDIINLKNLKLSFEYNRNFYTSDKTEIKLLNIPLKNIELNIPEKLSFHLLRKFTRVNIPSEVIALNITGLESGSSPITQNINIEELPGNLKSIYVELLEEKPDLKKIVTMIGNELSRFTNRFKTNIFKDLNSLSPLEKVVQYYKKTFWISDTDNLNNYVHLGGKYNMIGYEKYFELVKKTLSPEILEQIRHNYISRNITSYCMVPVLIGDRVVGVIEVSVPEDAKYKKLTIYDIFYIKGMADILAEVVVKSKAFSEEEGEFEVIDVSMGGILASTKNIYLPRSYAENAIVNLQLKLESNEVKTTARVVRYEYIPGENAGLNVAFEFLGIGEEAKTEIGKFIRKYMKQLNIKDQSVVS